MRYQVLVDRAERPTKCTILPLADHPALQIVRFAKQGPLPPLAGDLLLHPEGRPLDDLAKTRGDQPLTVCAIDSTWRKLPGILSRIAAPWPEKVRIPDGFVTAYPRRNKENLDPEAGLATIEALFIAGALLGHWDESLLGKYHFAPAFLSANRDAVARFGAGPRGGAP